MDWKQDNTFCCDAGIKASATTMVIKMGKLYGWDYSGITENNNDVYAPIDLKWVYYNSQKKYRYALEIKQRNASSTDYDDVMFEWQKIKCLRQAIKEGYRGYFFNYWDKDDVFEIYDLSKITDDEIRTGYSYQKAHTKGEQYADEEKRKIKKAYMPRNHKAIVLRGKLSEWMQ